MKELRMGGTIVYRTKKACAYADDSLMEIFDTLEERSMGKMRDMQETSGGKPEGKKPQGKPRHRWKDSKFHES
jgi:hypothetical protein